MAAAAAGDGLSLSAGLEPVAEPATGTTDEPAADVDGEPIAGGAPDTAREAGPEQATKAAAIATADPHDARMLLRRAERRPVARAPALRRLFAVRGELVFLESTTVGTSTLLVYDDIPAAHAYLVEVFGLTPGPVETHGSETVHAEVRAPAST